MRYLHQISRLILATLWLLQSGLFAQEHIPKPTNRAISDFSEILSESLEQTLSRELQALYESSSTQTAVITVPVAWRGTMAIEEYSMQLANAWKIGSSKNDNGVILLIVGSKSDRQGRGVRIEVGYGLEDVLSDFRCKAIIEEVIVPELKNQQYDEAVFEGVQLIKGYVQGAYQDEPRQILYQRTMAAQKPWVLVFGLLFLLYLLFYFLVRIPQQKKYYQIVEKQIMEILEESQINETLRNVNKARYGKTDFSNRYVAFTESYRDPKFQKYFDKLTRVLYLAKKRGFKGNTTRKIFFRFFQKDIQNPLIWSRFKEKLTIIPDLAGSAAYIASAYFFLQWFGLAAGFVALSFYALSFYWALFYTCFFAQNLGVFLLIVNGRGNWQSAFLQTLFHLSFIFAMINCLTWSKDPEFIGNVHLLILNVIIFFFTLFYIWGWKINSSGGSSSSGGSGVSSSSSSSNSSSGSSSSSGDSYSGGGGSFGGGGASGSW